MKSTEKQHFASIFSALCVAYNREINQLALDVFWDVLRDELTIEQFENASRKHLKSSKFFPTPAELLEIAKAHESANSKHVPANEAWAIALAGQDEYDSVVTNPQILEAFEIAKSVLNHGDEVGARMAFIDAYKRIIENAPPPTWFLSAGFDQSRRQAVVDKAVSQGLLPASTAPQFALPSPVQSERIENPTAIIEMLRSSLKTKENELTPRQIQEQKYRLSENNRRQKMLDDLVDYEKSKAGKLEAA